MPTYLLFGILAGWLNRQQQAVIDYLKAENGQIIEPGKEVGRANGKIRRRERLGGMLNYYYRDAA